MGIADARYRPSPALPADVLGRESVQRPGLQGRHLMTSDCVSVPVADASGLVVGVGDLEGNPTWFATK